MSRASISSQQFSRLILFLALASGAAVRWLPTLLAGFPVNDGGMFAVMVDDLRQSAYALPLYTSYNLNQIPYAYPPLGFYLGRIFADLTGFSALEVARWLPAFFSTLAVGAFYPLARRLLPSALHASLATLFFALMPRAFSWFVEGGGITRSPAQFFMLLTFASVLQMYQRGTKRDVLFSGVWGALTVLSHPEAAVHTAFSAVLFWLFWGRTRRSFLQSLGVAGLVLLLSSPWWGLVLARHGVQTILAAAGTGQKWLAVLHLVFFAFTEEPYMTLISVFGVLGVIWQVNRRHWLFPLWLALPFFVEGRSAFLPAAIPLALLAAIAVIDILLARLQPLSPFVASPGIQKVFLYLFFYLLFSASLFSFQISAAVVYPGEQTALAWIRQNTPLNARFAVLTGSGNISYDPLPEWFPALTGRHSLFTVQGLEWVPSRFGETLQKSKTAQECLRVDADCLLKNLAGQGADYLYLTRQLRTENFEPLEPPRIYRHVEEGLRAAGLPVVYESEDALIFQLPPSP